jgi:hypothetical protein
MSGILDRGLTALHVMKAMLLNFCDQNHTDVAYKDLRTQDKPLLQ